jgi:hypothetical protein
MNVNYEALTFLAEPFYTAQRYIGCSTTTNLTLLLRLKQESLSSRLQCL